MQELLNLQRMIKEGAQLEAISWSSCDEGSCNDKIKEEELE